jgi:DNA-binding SARP family transcriptional activator
MELRILGALEVEEDGRLVRIAGAKQRTLLALLLLHANEPVPRDRLIEELWASSSRRRPRRRSRFTSPSCARRSAAA